MEDLKTKFYEAKEWFDIATSSLTFIGEDTTREELLEMLKIASNLMVAEQLKEVSHWVECLEDTVRCK